MKRSFYFGLLYVVLFLVFGCTTTSTVPLVYTNNTSMKIQILGVVTYESSDRIGYLELLRAAQALYPDCDYVIDIMIDQQRVTKTFFSLNMGEEVTYTMRGVAVKYLEKPADLRVSTGSTGTASPASAPATSYNTPSGSAVVFAGNGHRYEVINKPMTWTKARDECKERGGYLATITSKEEQKFIVDLLSKQGKRRNYWLGGYREGKNWKWVTGEDFTYTNWIPGEPSGGNEDKLLLSQSHRNQWNDSANTDTKPYGETLGYICEWDD